MDKTTLPNDPVAGLIDFPLPVAVSLWPATWPSRIAILLLLVASIVIAWRVTRRWYADRYRREALSDLRQIMSAEPTVDALALLVRRTALAVFPRETVAPLSGRAWLAFLDRSYGGTEFSEGAGRALSRSPYEPPHSPGTTDVGAAAAVVRRWIQAHHV